MKANAWLVGALISASALAGGWLYWLGESRQPAPAPDFTVTTLENETFRLADHRGEVVVLQFFATWCVTCESTAKALHEVRPEWNGTGVRVLTIATDPSVPPEDVRRWRDERGYQWPFALDTDQVAVKYGVYALGRVVIVDAQGMIAYSKEGTVSSEEFRTAVGALVA